MPDANNIFGALSDDILIRTPPQVYGVKGLSVVNIPLRFWKNRDFSKKITFCVEVENRNTDPPSHTLHQEKVVLVSENDMFELGPVEEEKFTHRGTVVRGPSLLPTLFRVYMTSYCEGCETSGRVKSI